MNILITGSGGFIGKNLHETLKNIKSAKDKRYSNIVIDEIFCYDINSTEEELNYYCENADFVFNLAGTNRPTDKKEFKQSNYVFADKVLNSLKKYNNKCPVMLASSVQASLKGRYAGSEYGRSKRDAEDLFFEFAKINGSKVLVYRFTNVFGKWSQPNYNSVIATFCYNIANNIPIEIHDPNVEIEFVYIDDLIEELISSLISQEHRCEFDNDSILALEYGKFCYVPITHKVKIGEVADLLYAFSSQSTSLLLPTISQNSFSKKLFSTYLSFLPPQKAIFSLNTNYDGRGSFTEVLKTVGSGQFSLNVSKPGVTKGQHWHNTKWEFFVVISGEALIKQRKIGSTEVFSYKVNGSKLEVVRVLPGYTHNLINLSNDNDLITLIWANEIFDKNNPDTFSEIV